MNIKSGTNDLFGLIKRLGESMSHIHSGISLIGAMFGKEPTQGSGGTIAHGLYGMFGCKDEIVVSKILNEMNTETKDIFLGFLEFIFPDNTKEQLLITLIYGNKFRTFIAKKAQGNEKVAKRFIGKVVATIKRNGGGVSGYKVAQQELWLLNIPIPPKTAPDTLNKLVLWLEEHPEKELEQLCEYLEGLAVKIKTYRRKVENRQPRWARFITNWI